MAKLAVDQFVEVVKRSGLIDDERLSQALSGVDQSIQDSGVVASKLTRDGLLTEWQSEKLLQGRHKGFYLGKYKLLSQLGAGGMGAVYLAEHRVMRHRVAIKLLPHHLAGQKSYLDRFIQEARASAQLNHRNMVRAFDVDQEDKNHFLVMEYVEGTDLQALVSRNGPLSPQQAADYTRQAADGLAYAHRVGLIHRDIKPANLLVDKAGTVKILDMGLARFSDDSQASLTREYDQKMIGTVDYLAPEQAVDSHKVDARADIYSLGCTLFYLLTGREPFVAETVLKRLMAHLERPAPSLRAARPDVPTPLEQAYQKMMAKRPADRPASMTAVIASGSEPERDRRIPWAGAARRPAQVFAPAEGLPRDTPERPASRRTTRSSSWTPPAGGQPARIPPMSRPRRRSSRSPRPTRRSCLRPARASPAAGNASRPACRGWSTWGRFPTAMTSRPMHWLWSIRARSARSSF